MSDQNLKGLLDFRKIPGGMISGLEGNDIQAIINDNENVCDDFGVAVRDDIFKDLDATVFADIENQIITEMNEAEAQSIPKSTNFSTKTHVDKFKKFLADKSLSTDIETMPVNYLSQYLRYYYYSLRTKEGSYYSPNSLIGIRAAIQRYLTSPTVNRIISIISDREFNRANGTLKAMIGLWLKNGQKAKGSFDAIQPNDILLLNEYFDASNPIKLQQEIWFNLTYYFGLRGRETLPQLTKHSIGIQLDSDGKEFAYLTKNVISKNVKISFSKKENTDAKDYRLYANDNPGSTCPLARLKLYMSKIPGSNQSLFPLPEKNWIRTSNWYCKTRGMGTAPLGSMMKAISEEAGLSKTYTNHCVRVTVISELKDQGYANEDIASITGHKNTCSVARYVRQRTDSAKRKLCQSLQVGRASNKVFVSQQMCNDQQTISVTDRGNSELIVQFTGTFNGCTFNIDKSLTK